MTVLVAFLAAGIVGGAVLVASGWSTTAAHPPRGRVRVRFRGRTDLRRRIGLAAASAAAGGVLTRWPIAVLALGALGWFAPTLFDSKASRDKAIAKTEAIAAWTEMLRDTLAGAHGLEETLMTTSVVAPAAIRREVTELAVRLERQPLAVALRNFANDLGHPTADLVVASLTLAAEGAVGDLGELLGTLSVSAREEAGMHLRVDAARARLRTAVRVIAGCTAATAVGLVVLNRPYLQVYEGLLGQSVLAGVAGLWGVSLVWLSRMGDFISPERFLAVHETGADTAIPAVRR